MYCRFGNFVLDDRFTEASWTGDFASGTFGPHSLIFGSLLLRAGTVFGDPLFGDFWAIANRQIASKPSPVNLVKFHDNRNTCSRIWGVYLIGFIFIGSGLHPVFRTGGRDGKV